MEKDSPDILFIPPLGLLVAILLTIVLGRWAPLGVLPAYPWLPGLVFGGLIMVVAIWINVTGFRAFKRAGTNVNPYRPALLIVRDGPFQFTRNPMYLGMTLFVLGFGLLQSILWGPILAGALWAALHFGVVLAEERYLTEKFGDAYRDLLANTRRWL